MFGIGGIDIIVAMRKIYAHTKPTQDHQHIRISRSHRPSPPISCSSMNQFTFFHARPLVRLRTPKSLITQPEMLAMLERRQ
jgi:hypothetical protein